jgi:ABC-type polar amino acid transport system ATPase subunit
MSASVVRVTDLSLRRGPRVVLRGVSVDVEPGDIVSLMGASGSGKTTLLRVLAGLEPFEQGRVEIDGVVLGPEPDGAGLRALRSKVGMVFQFHCLFEHLTALHNVSLAPVHVHRVAAGEAEGRARDLLRQLGVEHRAGALPRELSGGEAQRVAIARALATDPPVLLMDEPTASLDPARRTELVAILRTLVQRGRTLVVATHDEEFVRALQGRVVRLVEGAVTDRSGAERVG